MEIIGALKVLDHRHIGLGSACISTREVDDALGGQMCRKIIGQQRLQRVTRCLLRKYPFSESNKVCVFDDGFKGIVDKQVLGLPTPVLFESHEVMGVEHAHEYLTHMYGDYMAIPPHDDQKQHCFYYVDFDKPYNTYTTYGKPL